MRGRHLSLGLAVMLGVVALGGCTSSPSTGTSSSAPSTGATIPPGRSASHGGIVQLITYSNNDGPKSRAIVTGAIGDFGTAESLDPNGTIDPEHASQLGFLLRRGSFRLDIAGLDRKIVTAFANFPPDRTTCSGTVIVSRLAPVVPGSGTGSYSGMSGRFNLTVRIGEVDSTSNCGAASAFLAQAVLITGTGAVSFSSA